jgi:hypothetical protein
MLAPSTSETRYISTSWTRTGGRTTPHRLCWLHPPQKQGIEILPGPGLEGGRHLTNHAGSIHLRHKVYKYVLDQEWREDDTSQTMLAPSTSDTRYISTSWTRTGGRNTPHLPCWLHPVMLLLNRFVTFFLYFIFLLGQGTSICHLITETKLFLRLMTTFIDFFLIRYELLPSYWECFSTFCQQTILHGWHYLTEGRKPANHKWLLVYI